MNLGLFTRLILYCLSQQGSPSKKVWLFTGLLAVTPWIHLSSRGASVSQFLPILGGLRKSISNPSPSKGVHQGPPDTSLSERALDSSETVRTGRMYQHSPDASLPRRANGDFSGPSLSPEGSILLSRHVSIQEGSWLLRHFLASQGYVPWFPSFDFSCPSLPAPNQRWWDTRKSL